jgi:hypothetical protein
MATNVFKAKEVHIKFRDIPKSKNIIVQYFHILSIIFYSHHRP